MKMNEKQKEYTVTLIKKHEKNGLGKMLWSLFMAIITAPLIICGNLLTKPDVLYNIAEKEGQISAIVAYLFGYSPAVVSSLLAIWSGIESFHDNSRASQLKEDLELAKLAEDEPAETKSQSR